MLRPIAVILLCQLAGEAVGRGLALPVPGPVFGLLFLFLLLLWRGEMSGSVVDAGPDGAIGGVADRLLAILGLLFVPAGVGVIDHLGLISVNATGFALVLIASVLVTLLVTVFVFIGMNRLLGRRGDPS